MSFAAGFQEMQVSVEEIRNRLPRSGDKNANQLSSGGQGGCGVGGGYSPSTLPPFVADRDQLVIWGSEQSCLSRQLRQFELVACPDIHSFLDDAQPGEENEDDAESLRDGKDEGPMSISSCSTASSSSNGVKKNDNDTVEDKAQRGRDVQRRIICHSTEELDTCFTDSVEKKDASAAEKGRRRRGLKESKSETNVFVSSFSTLSSGGSLSSSLDYSGEPRVSLLSQKSNHSPTANNTTSAQVTGRATRVDANQNSPPTHHPQEKHGQHHVQGQRQEEGGLQRRNSSSDAGLGQRRKAGFEERVLPPRRQQLVRPLCQTETEASRAQAAERARTLSSGRAADSQPSGSARRFSKSSLREPSDFSHLYSVCGVSQQRCQSQDANKQVSPAQRPPAASPPSPATEKRPPTQLTYRRNCSSPNRTRVDSGAWTPPRSPLRTPQSSPRRQPSTYLSAAARHTPSGSNSPLSAPAQGNASSRAPAKANPSTTGNPTPPFNSQQSPPKPPQSSNSSPKPKPKGVRPKIITYVRKTPQRKPQAADGPYQVSSLPSRLSSYVHGTLASHKDPSRSEEDTRGAALLSASNVLFDKYRQDMQANMLPSGFLSRSIRAPGYTNTVPPAHSTVAPHGHGHPHNHTAAPKLGGKTATFYKASSEVGCAAAFKESSAEEPMKSGTAAQPEGSNSLLRSGRGLRLGLGAVHRTASLKGKSSGQGPRATLIYSQPIQPLPPAAAQTHHGNAEDEAFMRRAALPASATVTAQAQILASRSVLPKPSQTGLRQPGFGFVRTASVSWVASAHSADSTQSDPCRTAQRQSASEEPPQHRASQSTERGRSSLQPPSTPALPRRYLPAQPRSSPGVGRKEFQRGSELTRSLPSSPKRLAVVPPKPQSPVQSGQRSTAAARGPTPHGSPRRSSSLRLQPEQQGSLQKQRQAEDREKVEHRLELQGRCEQQELQLQTLREEVRRTSLGLEAFIITTQHYCLKNKTAEEHKRSLLMEIQMIREDLASTSGRWERLVQEKAALQAAFGRELQELQLQQEAELAAVEAGLRKCHSAEAEHLKAEHRSVMEELRAQQQEQMEEMSVHHQAAMQELREMHNITMATLHEEHARTMRDLRRAHEQQKVLLEQDLQKSRLALQDQVDTLTFQNQGLQDKAKRFEEALRRSTDEQILEALAPYQHIEQDLRSLKEVVEMKNQQIHQQEMKISHLEKVAQKNVTLEERVQLLQQQNEDLKARIDMNLALSRQLSEENANLQESVEKESTEKKRLSRNNEELLWRLQSSPLASPASSPLHRSSSPVPTCGSPSHCQGCPRHALFTSPSHGASGPATPTHRVATAAACLGSPPLPPRHAPALF
ncbi:microtubule-associated tumor suppressor candidate 2 isoform X2 [Synchiropus splendidus]|uniref:microtubule-associated tumor suppressor candidate 2 isoform X2 n=1 Tax=Synchiropus splendidus TaxID=270530 RepID=UPI00237D4E31|nr:microtubule-associated tumor suppressor candidate 2 isoform X2 [Synchiropus splendidus]